MAIEAGVHVLEKEGVSVCFGVPGAAINPFYAAMRAHGGIRHVLARHVEGASHMADGYTGPRRGTSASASAPPGRPGPT
jgi:tartronate-semialdehyde synthase